jgi:hypothetical protein
MLRANHVLLSVLGAASLLAVSLSPAAAATLSESGCVRYDDRVCTTMQTCVLDTTTNHGTCYYYVKGRYTYYQNF